jgi:hypothetical protein
MTELLERLSELERKATAGHWFKYLVVGEGWTVQHGPGWLAKTVNENCQANAEFIAVTRNALPSLLAVARAAQEYMRYQDSGELEPYGGKFRRDALRAALSALAGKEGKP